MGVDEGGEGGDGGQGGADFEGFFLELDAEVLVEEDGDFEDVDRVEAEAGFAEDGGFGGNRNGGSESEALGKDFDELGFGFGHFFTRERRRRDLTTDGYGWTRI